MHQGPKNICLSRDINMQNDIVYDQSHRVYDKIKRLYESRATFMQENPT